ncbi:MAG: response regulator [Brevundimonas sp.]|uniref:response regulator n=1 Tax=Brevundimonas sp. TaxID=1871086 RepID=UPI0027243825|nr:response regulator [Brevundimonas sp.]MDO9589173.1 response regulator [Brevundimonas sp.]MDP3370434.1 response regulator [Brevundimonas sp.]MDP3656261.1 response regulator [Brevundimonas sp.]MDZ4112693.1 response regulator [Brevundimonas sp.]
MSSFSYVLGENSRILFVDDDPILREFAQVNLASPLAAIEAAADGAEAVSRLAVRSYDLILLDLEMPVMDGFAVLSLLRADPLTEHLPVIVQTGREDVEAIDRAFRLGATSFVTKPLNWRLLSYQIRYVLRASEAERRVRAASADTRAAAA